MLSAALQGEFVVVVNVSSPTHVAPSVAPSSVSARPRIGTVRELLERLRIDLDRAVAAGVDAGRIDFPLRVPAAFVDRMEAGRLDDPLLRQVLPWTVEKVPSPAGWSADPLAELTQGRARGALISKYEGRALLLTTGACAVHCRYCFRRHFPYGEHAQRSEVRAAIRGLTGVRELILSGGDPLTLDNDFLCELVAELLERPQVDTLRIHTRTAIVDPGRIDDALLRVLEPWTRAGRQLVVVVHCNHAREIDGHVEVGLARLGGVGATLLNQSVLLRGVNDDVLALVDLSRSLFAASVLPYYLHLLDPVEGAAHFDVPEAEALQLWRSMQGRLPGYLVPRLAREVPGRPGKTILVPPELEEST